MDDTDREAFGRLINTLAATFRQEASPALMLGYWTALQGLPFDDVATAIRRGWTECEFMPPPATLKNLMRSRVVPYHQPYLPEPETKSKFWDAVPPISNAEMVQVCLGNAEAAGLAHGEAKRLYDRLPVGDPQLPELRRQMTRWHIDVVHWREYAEYYRRRGDREGHATAVPVPRGMTRPPLDPGPTVERTVADSSRAPDVRHAPAVGAQEPALSDEEIVDF